MVLLQIIQYFTSTGNEMHYLSCYCSRGETLREKHRTIITE